MNIEGFFVRTTSVDALRNIISKRLNSPDDPPGSQPNWGLETSYDAFIVGNRKRKVALSKPASGWIAGIESKEVVDFALLQLIGQTMSTDVVVYQLSEITGGCGHAVYKDGHVAVRHFDEESENPLAQTRSVIKELGIPFELKTFREAVQDKLENWEVVEKSVS